MSSTSRKTPRNTEVWRTQAQENLRRELQEDLLSFLDRDVHISGYIVAWISRNARVDQLERLVDELAEMYGPPAPPPASFPDS